MSGFVAGVGVGMVLMLWLTAASMTGTADNCRAAHPGYDCTVGWVVGEAFK